jgi:hypothetical protein
MLVILFAARNQAGDAFAEGREKESRMRSMRILGTAAATTLLALSACSAGNPMPTGGAGGSALPGSGGSTTPGSGGSAGGTQQTVDATTLITLARSQCYGTCPVYSLTISGDGTVTYQGTQFVKVVGAASTQIQVSTVQALVDEMVQADYFTLSVPTTCAQGIITDAPTATTSLTLAGRSHTVENYHGNYCSPTALATIEDRIDEVAGSSQWVNCGTSSGLCPN